MSDSEIARPDRYLQLAGAVLLKGLYTVHGSLFPVHPSLFPII